VEQNRLWDRREDRQYEF